MMLQLFTLNHYILQQYRKIREEEIICALKITCKGRPKEVAHTIGFDEARIFPPKPNISKKELNYIKELNRKEDITILAADNEIPTYLSKPMWKTHNEIKSKSL